MQTLQLSNDSKNQLCKKKLCSQLEDRKYIICVFTLQTDDNGQSSMLSAHTTEVSNTAILLVSIYN